MHIPGLMIDAMRYYLHEKKPGPSDWHVYDSVKNLCPTFFIVYTKLLRLRYRHFLKLSRDSHWCKQLHICEIMANDKSALSLALETPPPISKVSKHYPIKFITYMVLNCGLYMPYKGVPLHVSDHSVYVQSIYVWWSSWERSMDWWRSVFPCCSWSRLLTNKFNNLCIASQTKSMQSIYSNSKNSGSLIKNDVNYI